MSEQRIRRPSHVQETGLRAALLHGEAAHEAWSELLKLTGGLDTMDHATFRMLPMVYRNLSTAGAREEELGPLKGIYRQAWYRNRVSLAAATRATSVLDETGIEWAALKGLGLIATAYAEPALRPMHDVDLLIRPGQFRAAAETLMAAGWQPLTGSRRDYFRRAKVFHALPLKGPDGIEVDLHRYMLEECCFPGADENLWGRIVTSALGELRVRTPGPEDHVINACVHGVRWDPVPALRWVIDAVSVIRSSADGFDWDYLVSEAERRGVSLGMAAALSYASEFDVSIPPGAREQLEASRPGRIERADFRWQQSGDGGVAQVARYLTRYGRLVARRPLGRKLAGFPTYLECMWSLDRPGQVPAEGIRRLWRRRPSFSGGAAAR